MLVSYGKSAFSPSGQYHLVMEKKHGGRVEKRVACGVHHKAWDLYGDEWDPKEYEAADKVLKSSHGCRKCQKIITKKATCFD